MSLPEEESVRSGSHVFSSASVKSDWSHDPPINFSEKTPSSPTKSARLSPHGFSSVSVKSDQSNKDKPNFSEKTPSSPTKSNKGQKTTVNIGAEFTRWQTLKAQKRLKSDVELATFLLNSLCRSRITEKQCLILILGLCSNPSHLRELDLSENQMKNAGVDHLCDVLKDSHCKLERLRLRSCDITDEGCSVLTSALKSNPSHLRELDLSGNKVKNKGLRHLCDILKNLDCKLERLSLNDCGITDVAFLAQTLAKTKALHFLKELDLKKNKIGNSRKQLSKALKDSNCNLSLDSEQRLFKAGLNMLVDGFTL